jgi:DNA ligase-1
MLAASISSADQLTFPCYASIKIDGIRAILNKGRFTSRSGKPIPNIYLQIFARSLHEVNPNLPPLDGELVALRPNTGAFASFHQTQSMVMSDLAPVTDGFTFVLFDTVEAKPFAERLNTIIEVSKLLSHCQNKIIYLHHQLLTSKAEAESCIDFLPTTSEGLCFRKPASIYKHGRGTLQDQTLLKYKPFSTSEAEVLLLLEKLTNENEYHISPLGLTERPSHASGKVPAETLGKMLVRDLQSGKEFYLGSFRLTQEEKQHLWNNRDSQIGKICTYQYLHHGEKDLPRNASFIGFRDERDL